MVRLPTPGGDDGAWGDLLNEFLEVSHDSDGSIKAGAVTADDVGLGNVDNTSDAQKPVSADMQTALDQKVTGPGSSTATHVATFSDTTGKVIQDSGVTLGSAASQPSSAFVAATLVDAKGDLIVGTADNAVTRLPVAPAAGSVLVSDPSQASGLNWATGDAWGALTLPGAIPVIVSTLANSANFMRWFGGGTFTKIALQIGTSSGNICVGSYSNTGAGYLATPSARQGTSGSVPAPASGYAEISLTSPTTWAAGDWGAVVWDNASATVFGAAAPTSSVANRGLAYYQSSAFPLPSTYGGSTTGDRTTRLWGVA